LILSHDANEDNLSGYRIKAFILDNIDTINPVSKMKFERMPD
jgi:hypothetical protein